MPITQDRFLNVITGAKQVINLNKAIHVALERNVAIDLTNANAVLAHTHDLAARETIVALLNRIHSVRNVFIEMFEIDTHELLAIIMAEEIHFEKHRKRNERAAMHQRLARQDRGAIPRPQAELKRTMQVDRQGPSVPITEPRRNLEESPEYKRISKEIREQFWPETKTQATDVNPESAGRVRTNQEPDASVSLEARKTLPMAELIALEQRENERLFGPLDLDARCAVELKLMQANTSATPEPAADINASVKAVALGGASYAPGVLRTSVPPASEMLEADVSEGKDVL